MTEEFPVPERALVVAAHADDIEFGMAGTVARWTAAGAQVTFCIVTDNSSGSNEPGMRRERLIAIRIREQLAAAQILGVDDVRFMGYRDGTLEHTLALRRVLTRLVRELRPQIVVSTDPTMVIVPTNNYINHPDHRATAEATLYAVFPSAGTRPIFPELLEEGLEPHEVEELWLGFTMEPTHVVDISDFWEQKAAALLCHKSQVGEEALGFVRGFGEQLGREKGYALAEAFRVIKLRREREAPDEQDTPDQTDN